MAGLRLQGSKISGINWRAEHLFLLVPAQQVVGQFLATFKEFPPRQKVGSWSLDGVPEKRQEGGGGGQK